MADDRQSNVTRAPHPTLRLTRHHRSSLLSVLILSFLGQRLEEEITPSSSSNFTINNVDASIPPFTV